MAQFKVGDAVKYWGNLSKYYGEQAVVLWVNECGCKHQTYAIELEPDNKRLEKVLEESIKPIES